MLVTNNPTYEQFKEYIKIGYYNNGDTTFLVDDLMQKNKERFEKWFYCKGKFYCNDSESEYVNYNNIDDEKIKQQRCYGNSQLISYKFGLKYSEGIIFNFHNRFNSKKSDIDADDPFKNADDPYKNIEDAALSIKDSSYTRHAFNVQDSKVFDFTVNKYRELFGEKQFYFGVIIPEKFRNKFYKIKGITQKDIEENKQTKCLLIAYFLYQKNLVQDDNWADYTICK